jgi:heptosyltransferase II
MVSLSPKIILLVKNRALGDSVMGLASLSYLRTLYPDAKIIYGVPKWIAPLYKNCQTEADEILPLDFSSLYAWWKLWWLLKKKSVDLVYEMHLSGRSKKFFDLFSSFNAIYYKFHNHHLGVNSQSLSCNQTNVHDQGKVKPLIQRDLDGLWSALACDSIAPHFLDFTPSLSLKLADQKQTTEKNKNKIIFGVVATRNTKMWRLENYVKLAREISEKTDYKIIIPLSIAQKDLQIERELISLGLPDCCQILKVSLKELPLEMSGSRFYIGNDTGLKHIAIALGIKTYTFFGPEPPLEWHPYNSKDHPYFYKYPLECRTKTAHYCGLSECDSMICLNEFLPKSIFIKIFQGK